MPISSSNSEKGPTFCKNYAQLTTEMRIYSIKIAMIEN